MVNLTPSSYLVYKDGNVQKVNNFNDVKPLIDFQDNVKNEEKSLKIVYRLGWQSLMASLRWMQCLLVHSSDFSGSTIIYSS